MLRQTFSSNVKISAEETVVNTLGPALFKNPRAYLQSKFELSGKGILINPFVADNNNIENQTSFEIAAPGDKIYFDPAKTTAGIVTCGGICPGLNNVVRAVVLSLYYNYGVRSIYGFRYGLQGFIKEYGNPPVKLDPKVVTEIHELGGTILGTSRGPQDIGRIVDSLVEHHIDQLYFIGGDGSLKASNAIALEISKRKLAIAIVSIPKTIDNDIPFASETFGFDTAVEIATQAIRSAHVEAKSHPNGIGLVKLMGRNAGFISAIASLSQRDVNFALIPEQKFELGGEKGLLPALSKRLQERKHAVIVVAEGAGQDLFNEASNSTDASGNARFGDIGLLLKSKIIQYFKDGPISINLKYIDPSYMIRSVKSNTHDNLFAATLGENAVHAVMKGKTNFMISIWHGVYCYVPLKLVVEREKRLSLTGRIWLSVLQSTGQESMINE